MPILISSARAWRVKAAVLLSSIAISAVSCAQPGGLPFRAGDGTASNLRSVAGKGRDARSGRIFPGQAFAFPEMESARGETGLVIEYSARGLDWGRVELLVLGSGRKEASTLSWDLALASQPLSFSLPIPPGSLPLEMRFSFGPASGVLSVEGSRLDPEGAFRGYARSGDRLSISPGCSIQPTKGGGKTLSLPLDGLRPGKYSLSMEYASAGSAEARLSGGGRRIGILSAPRGKPLVIPLELGPKGLLSLEMPQSFELSSFALEPEEGGPIRTDPFFILDWERSAFRQDGYEVFRWDAFPSMLILLFEDYREQDLALKRLAFFAEKAGFRGRLAPDGEIAALHGWNAHDYPASTLASFFSKAASEGFPLGERELQLRDLLEAEGIIERKGSLWAEGKGALLSVSLESSRSMRRRFLAHEGFHGIYFTESGFRESVREVWESVDPELKDYILEFFDFKELDVTDPGLMVNEFASYFLQTPYEETPGYFMGTVADFLEADRGGKGRYRSFAKEREGDFLAAARRLDAIVGSLYGLGAGRVWRAE